MSRRALGVVTAAGVVLVSWAALSNPGSSVPPAFAEPAHRRSLTSFLPGIAPAPAGSPGRYLLQHPGANALFTDRGVDLRLLPGLQAERSLGWNVAGARAVQPQAERPREAKLHRLVGPRTSWERELPTYAGVRYPGVLPGVDLWLEERAGGLEYGFRATRGADLRRVGLEYAGVRAVRVVEEGRALEVDLGEGVLRERGLRCEQEDAAGASRELGCRYVDARRVGPERWAYAIEVDVVDPERPVVVDPLVLWNTYLGSGVGDELRDIAVNAQGDVFIVGTVGETPLSPPTDAGLGGSDVLVARFHEDGGLVWSTLLGGSGEDSARAIALGGSDEVYVAGVTTSQGLSVKIPADAQGYSLTGVSDAFVAQLSGSAGALDWFMYYGGSGDGGEQIHDLAVIPDSGLLLVGETTSEDLPGTGGTRKVVGTEAFLVPLHLQGTDAPVLGVGWFMMGSGETDVARAVSLGAGGVFVAGTTNSSDLGKNIAITQHNTQAGGVDAFVARFNLDDRLLPDWLTFVGGSSNDEGRALVLDEVGNRCLVAGTTESSSIAGTVKDSLAKKVFVSNLVDSLGSVESTVWLEGALESEGVALALDKDRNVYVAARAAPGFVPTGGFDSTAQGPTESFVARVEFNPMPSVPWSSFVGGGGIDEIFAMQIDGRNHLLMGGSTTSTDLRYADAGYDLSHDGKSLEMFLLSVDLDASTPQDAGTDGGTADGGGGVADAGPPDAGGDADAGTGGPPDAGTQLVSPVGWSCAAGGGPGLLALGALAGLALGASRRRGRAACSRTGPGL